MPVPRGVAQNLTYIAFDYTNNIGKTGDVANHTIRIVRDGVELTPTNSPSEIDSTDLPGLYALSATGTEMNGALIVVAGKSSTSGVSIVPTEITTEPA
jgi:hypothetical protein